MSDLLLELYSQELPEKEQLRAEKGYSEIFTNGLDDNNIKKKKEQNTHTHIYIYIHKI